MSQVMLDLETMGNGPQAAIIAIGAVAFDPFAGGLCDYYYQTVDLEDSVAAGLKMDASTVLWWMRQNDAARSQFSRLGMPLARCLAQFGLWLKGVGDDVAVWGNGTTFDNVILAGAYRAVGLTQPWPYGNDRCYRTLKALFPDIPYQHDGTSHHALDDAKSQALHLMKILERIDELPRQAIAAESAGAGT